MAENKHDHSQPPVPLPDLSKPENRHESTDVNVYAIGKFAIGLILTSLFCVAIMVGLFQFFLGKVGGKLPSRLQEPSTDARQLPPEPLLEKTPVADLAGMHEAENKILSSYRWVDQSAGIVGLPIDRAMDLLAQRGLPARTTTAPQSAAAGVSVPTASALSPKLQTPGGPLPSEGTPGK